MFADVTYEEARHRRDIVWIDVRSELEHRESTIPHAVSVPLFNDEERARVGTVYKQEGPEAAQALGLVIASAKLPTLVEHISTAAAGRIPVIFCWRGGMRSKAVATVVDLLGAETLRLQGGYRAYRHYVVDHLEAMTPEDVPQLIVLHGMTGVGKTMILQLLAQRGEPVLDLEALAGHRGSVFGGIGLTVANQRQFDARLLLALEQVRSSPYAFIEAESKRIGRVSMPDFLFEAKLRGCNIELTAAPGVRVDRTLLQYRLDDPQVFHEQVERAMRFIEKRFSPDLRKRAFASLAIRDYHTLIEMLLVEYYDPRYRHAMNAYEQPFTAIDAADCEQAATQIQAFAKTFRGC